MMSIFKQSATITSQRGTILHSELIIKILLCLGFAAITGLSAQMKWFVPGNPVPFTMQTAAVILSALWLKKWAGLSQLFYIILGCFGIPWFSNYASGMNILFLPTAGYLIGFVFTGYVGGWFVEKYFSRFHFSSFVGLFLITVLFTHGFGLLYLSSWMYFTHQTGISMMYLLTKGTLPFLLFDLFKIMLVTGLYTNKA